jgi:hypothetical protein
LKRCCPVWFVLCFSVLGLLGVGLLHVCLWFSCSLTLEYSFPFAVSSGLQPKPSLSQTSYNCISPLSQSFSWQFFLVASGTTAGRHGTTAQAVLPRSPTLLPLSAVQRPLSMHWGGTTAGSDRYYRLRGTTADSSGTTASRTLEGVKWWARGVLTSSCPFTSPPAVFSLSGDQELLRRPAPALRIRAVFSISNRWDRSPPSPLAMDTGIALVCLSYGSIL